MIPRLSWWLALLVVTSSVIRPSLIVSGALPAASGTSVTNLRLKVSANRRYLIDQKGDPFLVVGDSPWSLIAQLDETDIEWYLRDRQKKGFTWILVTLMENNF